MSWMNFAVTDGSDRIDAEPAQRLAARAVRWRRQFGMKGDHAFDDAGASHGKTGRYFRALVRGELIRIAKDDYASLLERHWQDLERQAQAYRAAAEAIDREAAAARLAAQQLQVALETPCSASSAHGLRSGDTSEIRNERGRGGPNIFG